MLELGNTCALEQLAIDDAVIKMVEKVAGGGIPVSDETISLDSVRDVKYGNFLEHDSTISNMDMHSEHELIDRNMRGDWESKGSQNMTERAHDFVNKVLSEHEVKKIDSDLLSDMEDIVKKADKNEEVKVQI
ncbi:MAG: Trimethylamine:corrinoid methyltransferase MttB1 [Candidatus Methanohalarchaeum thermophilum]|uniref:Trimethylamine:corrinoid methyltransferase MttB1 n=1 Tax=Methanohalarchaeum thermophilum TaxID=1903181 RepID=A0A1Q6DT59_METT1|nr:MAG: Trimethylamine:corrinoid methyltransferase MttB1 [Candidatus Methanohalarchaeum thermophilum]